MRSILRGGRSRHTTVDDTGAPRWSRRRLRLAIAGAGACVAGGVLALVGSGLGYAASQVTITSGTATCFVVVKGQCSYNAVTSALSTVESSGAAVTIDLPGWDDAGLSLSLADQNAYLTDDTDNSLVLQGTVHLPQTDSDVPAQLSAYWGSDSTPTLAFAVKPGDDDLSAFDAQWNVPGLDLHLGNVVLASSPTDGYVLDPATLPGTFLDGVPAMTLKPGLNLHADVAAGQGQPEAVTNALNFIGLTGTDSTSIDGLLSDDDSLLFNLESAAGSHLDLTLTASSTGGSLPSWINARTSSIEFEVASTQGPRITIGDELDTSINGTDNDFTGSATFDASSADGTTLSMTYGVKSGATFVAPLGLGTLNLSDAELTLAMTTGETRTYSGSLDLDLGINSKSLGLHVDIEKAGPLVTGTFGLTGDVSVADAAAVGNALLGTNITAPSGAEDIALNTATFSFSTSSDPAQKRFALEAGATLRGAKADALVSIAKDGTDPAKLFAGVHVADLAMDDLVDSPSPALEGLSFPDVGLFFSKGYLDNGQPTDVPWSDLLPAEQAFFTSIYGDTPPDSVRFGPTVTFDGTVLLPDAVSTVFDTGEPLHLHGELGTGLDALGTGAAPKLAGSLTAELPPVNPGVLPDWIDGVGPWSITVAADSNGSAQVSLDGDVQATIDDSEYDAAIEGAFTHTSEGDSLDLSGTVTGTFDHLFGFDWLSVTDPAVHLAIEHTAEATTISGSLDADVTTNGYTVNVAADISTGDGTEASLSFKSVDSTATVGLADIASLFGASPADLPSLGGASISLTALHGRATYSSTAGESLDVVADTSLTLGGDPVDSQLLLSLRHQTALPTKVVVGFRTTHSTKLSDIVSSLPSGVDFTFPTLAVVAAHPAATLKSDDLLPEESDFFQPFCGNEDSACHDKITVADGISFISATLVPESVSKLIGAVSIDPDAPVLVTGTIPVFGGSDFALTVDLPQITGSGDTPDFFQSGRLSLKVDTSSLSFTGHITFNIPKPKVDSDTECAADQGIWRPQRGTGKKGCYDQVPFALTAEASIPESGPPSMTLTGGLEPGYIWHSPMGATWLDLNRATIQFGITAGTPVEFTLGFALDATIAQHEFGGAMLIGIEPLEAPPFIAIDPKGLRIDTGTGLSMQDMVDIANAINGTSLTLGQVPNIAVRNVEFSFAEVNDAQLCLTQGVHIAADLYINPTKDAHVVSDAESCPTTPEQEESRTQICQDDSANGCFAAVDFAINDNGLRASGSIGGFDADPLHFGGALVDIAVTPSTQHLVVHGDASIKDFASGQVDLLISRTLLHFRASASLFGTETQAFLDGQATIPSFTSLADLEKGGSFQITAVLKSDFLNKAAVAISGTLQQLKPALQVISAVLLDLDQGHVLTALTELPTKVTQLGVSLPAPYGDAMKTVSDKLSSIQSAISAFDHDVSWGLDDLLNGFTLSFPGVPGIEVPETCITTWSDGDCYTTPPVDTIFGTIPGIPGTVVPATCITTRVGGTCYSVPPITGVHIPGLCEALHSQIDAIPATCNGTSISDNLLLPILRTIIQKTTGYDIGQVSLHDVLTKITDALGSGKTVSIDCAEFKASAVIGASPSASVHLSADFNLFGDKLTAGVGWNFAADSTNPSTVITNLLNAIIHPDLNLHDTCELPADWNSNADFPDMVGTAPSTGGDDNPPPPTPTLAVQLAHSTIDEGSSASLTGTVTPTPSSDGSATVDWGDGTPAQTVTVHNGTFTATHRVDNNTPVGQPSAEYEVKASVAGGPSSSAVLTVANVAPSDLVLTPAHSSIDEGSATTLSGRFVDPGDEDTHTVSVTWGDGSTTTLSLGAGVETFTTAAHTYPDNNGTDAGFPVSATVTDDDLATTSASTTIDVANVAPYGVSVSQVCGTPPCSATTPEQQQQTFRFSFTDPGSLDTTTAVVDWGDGTPQQVVTLGTLRTFTVPHLWTEADTPEHEDGHLPITVTLTDKDGGVGTGGLTEVVTNVAPTNLSACLLGTVQDANFTDACPAAATIDEGDTVSLFGGFTDVSALDTHTVTIDWGPGWPAATRHQTLPLDVGDFSISASRAFGDEGTYPVTVTVADDDGASVATTVTLTVREVAPTAAIDHAGTTSVQGVDAFLGHAAATMPFTGYSQDPGNDDLTLTWVWGDGLTTAHGFPHDPAVADDAEPEDPTVDPKSVTDPESHAWASPCTYHPRLTSSDGDEGGVTSDTVDLVVTGNDPTRYSSGVWLSRYKKGSTATLSCDLRIVQRMSAVFAGPESRVAGAPVSLRSAGDAVSVLQPSSSDARLKLQRQILTMWHDFASGGFDYTTMLDTNHDRVADTSFASLMSSAESVALDPGASQKRLLDERNLLAPLTGD